jgi:predicted RNA-binding Zn-ribbon protein involved in translation (DUF1610 family)
MCDLHVSRYFLKPNIGNSLIMDCPECGHTGEFEESTDDIGDVIVCPACDWYGSPEDLDDA